MIFILASHLLYQVVERKYINMKRSLILCIFILVSSLLFSQSRKEILAEIEFEKDSIIRSTAIDESIGLITYYIKEFYSGPKYKNYHLTYNKDIIVGVIYKTEPCSQKSNSLMGGLDWVFCDINEYFTLYFKKKPGGYYLEASSNIEYPPCSCRGKQYKVGPEFDLFKLQKDLFATLTGNKYSFSKKLVDKIDKHNASQKNDKKMILKMRDY
jgi:hypothetical protein